MSELYQFKLSKIDGTECSLAEYKDKVLLIVNVASKCGFTSQYGGLQKLYKKYQDTGLVILGFPCNQFGQQEPGSEEEIGDFCRLNYGVSFPLFQKIDVNGEHADPLYVHLKEKQPGVLGSEAIKWNFTKFLVDKEGQVVRRFSPSKTPESIEKEIEEVINKK